MKKEYILGLLTVLFWSTSATAFKIALQLLLVSITISTLILGGLSCHQRKNKTGIQAQRKRIRLLSVLRRFESAHLLFDGD